MEKNKRIWAAVCCSGAVLLTGMVSGCGEKSVDSHLFQAGKAARSGNWKAADKSVRKAMALDSGSVNAKLFRGVVAYHEENYDLALDSFRQAATLNPEDFFAHYLLGVIYADDPGKQTEAFKSFFRAHKLRPEDLSSLIGLCNAAGMLRSRFSDSYLAELQKHPQFRDNGAIANQQAMIFIDRGEWKKARAKMLVACRSGNPQIILNTAVFFDRYENSPAMAKQFYRFFLKKAAGDDRFAEVRERVEKRLSRI